MVSKCVFPVAGLGTRFMPVTATVPKELLPVSFSPLITYGLLEAYEANIKEFAFVVSKKKKAIRDFFDNEISFLSNDSKQLKHIEWHNQLIKNCEFEYIEQKQMLGLGHAISTAESFINGQKFAVILPDDLCYSQNQVLIDKMIKVSNQYPDSCIVALEEVAIEEVSKYGIVSGYYAKDDEIFCINDMVEKPNIDKAPSNLAIIGRYVLTPNIFSVLSKTLPDSKGEIQITDALKVLAKSGNVIGVINKGKRFDCGNPNGLLSANNFFKEHI